MWRRVPRTSTGRGSHRKKERPRTDDMAEGMFGLSSVDCAKDMGTQRMGGVEGKTLEGPLLGGGRVMGRVVAAIARAKESPFAIGRGEEAEVAVEGVTVGSSEGRGCLNLFLVKLGGGRGVTRGERASYFVSSTSTVVTAFSSLPSTSEETHMFTNKQKSDHDICYFVMPLRQRQEAPRMQVIYQWKAQIIDSISN
jgi:hypothetical protein